MKKLLIALPLFASCTNQKEKAQWCKLPLPKNMHICQDTFTKKYCVQVLNQITENLALHCYIADPVYGLTVTYPDIQPPAMVDDTCSAKWLVHECKETQATNIARLRVMN